MRQTTMMMSAAILALAGTFTSCERDITGLEPAALSTDPIVFDDVFGHNVDYQAFLNSKLDAVEVDSGVRRFGSASLRVTVPGPGDQSGWYAGGAFTTSSARNLSGYNALTFWAKASMAATLDVAGLGNDNTETSLYTAEWRNIPVDTDWKKYVIPIPLPAKLTAEDGLFFFAEGYEQDMGYQLWFDEVQFETVTGISNPRPRIATETIGTFVGATVPISTEVIFNVDGTDQTIGSMPGYFTLDSSADSVVSVAGGSLRVVGSGSATVTGKLGNTPAEGSLTVNAIAAPTTLPSPPVYPESDVISLFTDTYDDIDVYSWAAPWQETQDVIFSIINVGGNRLLAYTNLVFEGILFKPEPPNPAPPEPTPQIDASSMTHLHMDIWMPQPALFELVLVDFGDDGRYGGTDANADTEHKLVFTPASNPPTVPKTWVNIDVPLSAFTSLASTKHLAQMVIAVQSTDRTVFIDNVLFHK